jgi:hypothetical protein
VDHLGARIEQSLFQILKVGIVEVKLPLQGAIRDTSQALQHRQGFMQDLFERHLASFMNTAPPRH